MLALDPPGDPTIGACLAGDLSGPRRHRYGAMRDLVIGVTVVLADGTIASSGGKVVKNVAGYDLGKLFSGSRGRLGPDRARRASAAHAAGRPGDGGGRDGRPARAVGRGAPLAARPERGRLPPARAGSRCSSRGARRRSTRQVRTCPGARHEDRSVWDESAARQARAGRPVAFEWQDCLLARPGARDRVGRDAARRVAGRRSPSACGRHSTLTACSSDGASAGRGARSIGQLVKLASYRRSTGKGLRVSWTPEGTTPRKAETEAGLESRRQDHVVE